MNTTTCESGRRTLTDTLIEAASVAVSHAPSVLNTQPWRWRVHTDRLELFADRSRQLTATDPDGRLLTLSCGAALHHARVALAARGWACRVHRTTDVSRPDLLAVMTGFDRIAVTPRARHEEYVLGVRHTDRRPVSDERLAPAVVRAIAGAAGDRARLHVLTGEQVFDLSAASSRAAAVQVRDSLACAELRYWTSRTMGEGTGLPDAVLPERPPQTTVPGRGFGHAGTLPIGRGHDRAATYALLYGDDDDPGGWLAAGEALSSIWLTATSLNVSVLPISDVVAVAGTRERLRRMLTAFDHPYLALRLGIAEPEPGAARRTPRLPAAQLIDTTPADRAQYT
ncbi:nitroreductase [Couchioplanes caeruleus]|uniref:Acg family FMN-binding oxidoreductase n=1 Tax=Couchioplanes caeruleus TaxID=56438 RepID=UPI0020C137A3|nr:nitroreductase [Couchioplanes caeruleus]UQU62250.1 nitroreductase [Couchioplanes caeruleus]